MKTIELSTGTLLVSSGSVPINTDLDGFQLLGHPSEITGEVWGKVVEVLCPDCFGDGVETCHNPDHGFLSSVLGAVHGANESACPCCGHNPDHKMKGKCYTCSGTGKVSKSDYDAYIDELVSADDITAIHEHCLINHGLSLIAAHNIQESDVLLFKAKL